MVKAQPKTVAGEIANRWECLSGMPFGNDTMSRRAHARPCLHFKAVEVNAKSGR